MVVARPWLSVNAVTTEVRSRDMTHAPNVDAQASEVHNHNHYLGDLFSMTKPMNLVHSLCMVWPLIIPRNIFSRSRCAWSRGLETLQVKSGHLMSDGTYIPVHTEPVALDPRWSSAPGAAGIRPGRPRVAIPCLLIHPCSPRAGSPRPQVELCTWSRRLTTLQAKSGNSMSDGTSLFTQSQ